MSQFNSKRYRQQNNNKTIGYLLLLIVVIIFLATVGVRLLLNTSIFISNFINNGKSSDTRQTAKLLGKPIIVDIPDATHSATIAITIDNVKNTKIAILVNDIVQNELLSDENSIETEIDLDEGDNTVQVETTDPKSNEKKQSPIYRVSYIQEKPKLDLTTPVDGMITDKEDITVSGNVGADISIRVNSQPVVVSGDGSFNTVVKLVNGENIIEVIAQNQAGTTETQTITVSYEP